MFILIRYIKTTKSVLYISAQCRSYLHPIGACATSDVNRLHLTLQTEMIVEPSRFRAWLLITHFASSCTSIPFFVVFCSKGERLYLGFNLVQIHMFFPLSQLSHLGLSLSLCCSHMALGLSSNSAHRFTNTLL